MIVKNELIEKVRRAAQRAKHAPGRGDPEMVDEWRIVVSAAERDAIVAALQKTPASAPLFGA
jgi:hypothetical protein